MAVSGLVMASVPATPVYILTIRCRDAVGIVAAVATTLAAADAFITESSHFGDPDTGLFFMRTVFHAHASARALSRSEYRDLLEPVRRRFGMQLELHDSAERMRVVLAVSRHSHCLNHLLHRWHSDELPIDVAAVFSNHDDLRRTVEWYGVPFHYVPATTPAAKPAQEQALRDLIVASEAGLLVLARYMQVLSPALCADLDGACINIHHSFLPSFKGAKPYHQAHDRGVKLVGATAHFVTPDLDEGPIIEQDIVRVDHAHDAEAFVRLGKDVENVVLARAVQWHAERRVFRNGQRTVVFRH
jgi:formyltetrahydrofolate deformylase